MDIIRFLILLIIITFTCSCFCEKNKNKNVVLSNDKFIFTFDVDNKMLIFDPNTKNMNFFSNVDSDCIIFYDEDSKRSILKKNNDYNYIKFDYENSSYKIMSKVPPKLIYSDYLEKGIVLKKYNKEKNKIAFFYKDEETFDLKLIITDIDNVILECYEFGNFFDFYWIENNKLIIAYHVSDIEPVRGVVIDVVKNTRIEISDIIYDVHDFGSKTFLKTNINESKIKLINYNNGKVLGEFPDVFFDKSYFFDDYIIFTYSNNQSYLKYNVCIYKVSEGKYIYKDGDYGKSIRFLGVAE